MKAALDALSELVHEPVPQVVLDGYQLENLSFGSEYILPKPTDPRLKERISSAVARAAVATGVAELPLPEYALL